MYQINVLTSKDFDELPESITRGSNINNSLGFADPRTGRAYVRHTGIPELNKYLIDHEFEELTTDKHSHEDANGIRHKEMGRQGSFLDQWISADQGRSHNPRYVYRGGISNIRQNPNVVGQYNAGRGMMKNRYEDPIYWRSGERGIRRPVYGDYDESYGYTPYDVGRFGNIGEAGSQQTYEETRDEANRQPSPFSSFGPEATGEGGLVQSQKAGPASFLSPQLLQGIQSMFGQYAGRA